MSIQSDNEIVDLLQPPEPILNTFSVPVDWYNRDSLVQPSSLDLHVGTIFIPPKEEPKVGDPVDRRTEYTLGPGQAIVVDTAEILNFPNHIAAFGFPPTTISNRAILMTNPGHIDPGFRGKLSFTLINMGREPYPIKQGMTVVTLLVIKLAHASTKDFSQRHPKFSQTDPTVLDLYRLGRDFLDLDQRTRKAAEMVVRQENLRMGWAGVLLTVVTAVVTGALALGAAVLQSRAAVGELKEKVSALESQLKIESRLKDVEIKTSNLPANARSDSNINSSQSQGGKKP